ncbi:MULTISPECIES: MarR family winged helix-turn-helix transcriptional regulator [unclassified Psychrobacter]|uniref:MarR family winged helix-turn-helix transcriptional regulator n=1 Tax=unclassified Psychrobacter TaxID=196806 RepID=UPI0018F5139F|nr:MULTISPECIES: MarR family transcriptional regulator [unclassified Psychrobacter]
MNTTSSNKPTGSAPTVSYSVGKLDKLINQQLSDALSELEVSLPQFTMLANLHLHGEMANAKLASRSFISPQASNQIIKTMEEKGWISKREDPNHGRILLIGLTPEGQAIYEQCNIKAMAFESRMLAGLPAENVMMLKATVQRLITNLKQGD